MSATLDESDRNRTLSIAGATLTRAITASSLASPTASSATASNSVMLDEEHQRKQQMRMELARLKEECNKRIKDMEEQIRSVES